MTPTSGSTADQASHQIIVDHQGQHVVWPLADRLPAGWKAVGDPGSRAELSAYLRQLMAETAAAPLLITDGYSFDTKWGS